jgi:hypothetical protein
MNELGDAIVFFVDEDDFKGGEALKKERLTMLRK